MKLLISKRAIKLRKKGYGIKTIANILQVSSSSVGRWCKGIVLTPEQIIELDRRYRDPYYGRRFDHIRKVKKQKIENINKLKNKGIQDIGDLTKRERFIAGVALYWAEGFKKDNRLGFANSDPKMINFFIQWLIRNCRVQKKDIRFRVGLNIGHKFRISEVEKYWSKITGITRNQFQKPYFQKFSWKKEFPKPDEYYGVLRIRVNKQLQLFRKIHGWIEGLKINIK
ncbi:hypothetical protein A2Y99_04495 [Candidatus Gottesmanbacteria bacterium RBG_13_37_7]|uniref:Uncharacterized protein n=1 Tax=Candidatus Gottesmanbacteria bacterium RBG_13_37_7 TaxID=1798369 RepID=A0A1F5YGB5_9BACT|nr:MAG: hypothetical protein A2Y99_04495 [Candidatus Gottesmanbacteria bacterium RBG_13_37_7]